MILRSLKVERFGCLNPGALIERFGPQITVIHGPNGAGKSTLFRALTYALYQRHVTTAQDAIAQIVPRGRDVGPRVEVVFEIEGTTWRLSKQFVRKAEVSLHRLEDGVFVPHAEGPEAEERIRTLLGSEKALKGLGGAALRGIGEILLVDQGAVRFTEVSQLARDRLRLVIDQVGTTQGAHELLAAVEKRYAEVFGKSGELRERSVVAKLGEDLERLSARKTELEAERTKADEIVAALAALDAESPAQAGEEIERLETELDAAVKLQGDVGKKRVEREHLDARVATLAGDAERARKLLGELKDARAERDRLSSRITEAERKGTELQEAFDRSNRARTEAEGEVDRTIALERQLFERERAVSDAKRAIELAARIPDLEERVKGWTAASERIRDVERAIAERSRPAASEIARIREHIQDLRSKERDAERLDVRIRITAEATVPVELGPERIELGARESRDLVTGDLLEVRIPGVARIEVKAPGGVERTRLVREIAAARAAVHEIGLRFGTEDLSKLEDLASELVGLESELLRQTAARDGLFKTERKAKETSAELGASRLTLAELHERHPDWLGSPPDPGTLAATEQEVLAERRRLVEAQTAREALLESRQKDAQGAAAALKEHEDALGALKLDLARAQSVIQQLSAGDEDDAAREKQLAETESQKAKCERALADCDAELDSMGDPQARIERLVQDKRSREASLQRAREERVRLTALLDQIQARGIWTDLGDVGTEIQTATERLEAERLGADALKLLRDVLVREQAAAVETALRPVADRVARMARFLFGAGAKATFGEDLAPRTLSADGCELPLELQSAGTKDQLALLCRVALGELYAEKRGRHAFVLDDPLVNCDRERRGKLLEIFAASRSLQIVVFTCSPDLYGGLGDKAVFVSMDEAKRKIASQASMSA